MHQRAIQAGEPREEEDDEQLADAEDVAAHLREHGVDANIETGSEEEAWVDEEDIDDRSDPEDEREDEDAEMQGE